jgi:hypothetical protein
MSCDVCGNTYRLEDVEIIEADGDTWAIVVLCAHCGTEGLVLAIANPLDENEVESDPFFMNQWDSGLAPLTERDVAEWRSFLAAFDGDLFDLLRASD